MCRILNKTQPTKKTFGHLKLNSYKYVHKKQNKESLFQIKKKYKRSKKTHTMHLQVRQRRRHQHEHAQLSPIPETLNYRLLAGEHPEHKSPYFFYVQLVSHMTIAAQSKRHDRSLRINQGRSKGPPSRDNTCLLKPQRRNGNRYMPPPVTKPNKTRPFQKKKTSLVLFLSGRTAHWREQLQEKRLRALNSLNTLARGFQPHHATHTTPNVSWGAQGVAVVL